MNYPEAKKIVGRFLLCLFGLTNSTLTLFCQTSLNDLNIILKHDFENNTIGTYRINEWRTDWFSPEWQTRLSETDIVRNGNDSDNPSKALQINFPANSLGPNEGGVQWFTNITKSSELYVSYDLYFMPGFQFQTGGKLPSVQGGTVNSGKPDGYDGFTGGLMFKEDGKIAFYIYYPDSKNDEYGDSFTWGASYSSETPFLPSSVVCEYSKGTVAHCTAGTWHNITYRIVLNSIKSGGGGNYDGILEAYFDGILITQLSHLLFRHTAELGIDCMRIYSFFGGNTDDWRNPIEEWLKIDNVLLYTYKSGIEVPRGNTLSPTNRRINYWRNFSTASSNPPHTPSALSLDNGVGNGIRINWTDNSDDESGFYIYRSPSIAGIYTVIDTTDTDVTEYTDNSVQFGSTYYYRVRAYNSDGMSGYSDILEVLTQSVLTPSSPTLLSAAMNNDFDVLLQWMDNSTNEYGFIIERTGPTPHTKATFLAGQNHTSYTDQTVKSNEYYTYRIRSYNGAGLSDTSATIQIFIQQTIDSIWSNSLTAFAVTANRVDLAWVHYPTAEYYKIERKLLNETNFNEIAKIPNFSIFFSDGNLSPSTTYIYRVSTDRYATRELKVSTPAIPSIPIAPSGLGIDTLTYHSVTLHWKDNSDNENYFLIERTGPDTLESRSFFLVDRDSEIFSDSSLLPNSRYVFRISSINTMGYSPFTEAIILFSPALNDSAWKSSIRAGITGTSFLEIVWDKFPVSTEYILEKKLIDSNEFLPVARLPYSSLNFFDYAVQPGTMYQYRLIAGKTFSDEIRVFSKLHENLPAVPSDLQGKYAGYQSIQITWVDCSSNEYGFILEKSRAGNNDFKEFFVVGSNIQFFTDTTVIEDAVYHYRIKAYNGYGYSEFTDTIDVTTNGLPNLPVSDLETPVDFQAHAMNGNMVYLSWSDNSDNEYGFIMERKLSDDTIFSFVKMLQSNVTSVEDNDLTPDTWYQYRLKAYNGSGVTEYTPWVAVKTFSPNNQFIESSSKAMTHFNHSLGDNTVTYANSASAHGFQQELIEGSAHLYPNPARNEVNLQLSEFNGPNGNTLAFVTLIDPIGRLWLHKAWINWRENPNFLLDLTSIPPGVYIVKLTIGTLTISERLVKL